MPRLTSWSLAIDFLVVKHRTATVADLRHNFRRASAWLENGECVEIIQRGRRFARLVPAAAPRTLVKIDFAGQLRAMWGAKVFSVAEVQAMRAAEWGRG
jgi:antitoxin (DNA-binding transcriptional repressor) of toxin-antitoxin stability system